MDLFEDNIQLRRRRSKASAAHYVGYVDDEESAVSIMKKFEELDRIKAVIKETAPELPNKGKNAAKETDDLLTQEQLEEVFKRTSMFSARSLQNGQRRPQYQMEELNEWQDSLFMRDRSDDEYDASWSDDDELWETHPAKKPRKVRTAGAKVPKAKAAAARESTTTSGYGSGVRKRSNWDDPERCLNDPCKPTYVRIPLPMNAAWAGSWRLLSDMAPKYDLPCSEYHEVNLQTTDVAELVQREDFQCIYMDPPLCTLGEEPRPGDITMAQLVSYACGACGTGVWFIGVVREYVKESIMRQAVSVCGCVP
ncbi:hypothetical protein SARC_10854 [Sphaeroforma arctica JP610]|uniref:Uncharacterized protein n=1 Tax=Sphaeroforma arctica JP610 TaxID=667725 RepID=A0A0L0FJL7_9EUKA|nr:hypothetical protein SARC_10854 [Sphaeroforma arctica JP610]KNC76651.1 hypothetical protein SARC_10854 [Sphaeroforma arctica JP610]|eukprot:XP_014150553.1 hypothetical protein SARC_10854 [Sphaeroforma arctica JP610]